MHEGFSLKLAVWEVSWKIAVWRISFVNYCMKDFLWKFICDGFSFKITVWWFSFKITEPKTKIPKIAIRQVPIRPNQQNINSAVIDKSKFGRIDNFQFGRIGNSQFGQNGIVTSAPLPIPFGLYILGPNGVKIHSATFGYSRSRTTQNSKTTCNHLYPLVTTCNRL